MESPTSLKRLASAAPCGSDSPLPGEVTDLSKSDFGSGVACPTAWNIIEQENIVVYGELGLGGFGNKSADYNAAARASDVRVVDNVIYNLGYQQPTDRSLAWAMGLGDVDGGLMSNNIIFHNGLFTDNDDANAFENVQVIGNY